jgi:hypothetical protein
MSIKTEIEGAANIKRARSEDEGVYAKRLVDAITELSDAAWGKLSPAAQKWFNEAVDAMNDNKDIPAFEEAAPATSTRRRAAAEPAAESVAGIPQAGDLVTVTTKLGKVYEGEFIELDGDTAVVKVGDEEMEFTADRTESLVVNTPPEEGTEGEPQEGDLVTLTTKRNAVVEGKVVEITDEVVVLEVNGKEAEYDRARVASIVIVTQEVLDEPQVGDLVKAVTKRNKEVEGKVVEIDGNILVLDVDGADVEVDMDTAKSYEVIKDEKKPARTRRGEASAPAAPARGKPGEKKPKVTKEENDGVSVSMRAREIICENTDMKYEQLAKQLKQEKLTFKEATLMIVYKDAHRIIELLTKFKHFK